ncbi:hypothetical protein BJ085DRAFT_12179, partial [Dimargaris cristalligena]
KVFVGNLAFRTTNEELDSFFSPSGKIVLSNVITRGSRSLGYGFIAFETPEAAEAAVASCNKKELNGRTVNVELARPKGDSPAHEGRPPRRSEGRVRIRGAAATAAAGGKRRFARRDQAEGESDETAGPQDHQASSPQAEAAGEDADGTQGHSRPRGRGRGRRQPANPRRFPRRSRTNVEEEGTPSTNTVFVANLAFETTEDMLATVFKDYKVASIHIITRRPGGRSKGFGFVVFEDESEQKRALANAETFEIDGRGLVIRIAM